MSDAYEQKFDRLQRAAIEFHGVLITNSAAPSLFLVSHNMNEQLSAKLRSTVCALLAEDVAELLDRQSERLSFLKEETAAQLRLSLASLLSSLSEGLRLGDVKTEVLQTWLAEIQSSVSSSADGESGDSVAASPRTNATASSVVEGQ